MQAVLLELRLSHAVCAWRASLVIGSVVILLLPLFYKLLHWSKGEMLTSIVRLLHLSKWIQNTGRGEERNMYLELPKFQTGRSSRGWGWGFNTHIGTEDMALGHKWWELGWGTPS